MSDMQTLLIVDDDSDALLSLTRALSSIGLNHRIVGAGSAPKALSLQQELRPQVAIVDLSLNETEGVRSGYNLISALIEADPSVRVIVLTGHGSVKHGVRCIELGAASFLEKPADISHLMALVRDATTQSLLKRELQKLRQCSSDSRIAVVGESQAARTLRTQLEFAAFSPQPVLLVGETGTGKSMAAQVIHSLSARSSGRFVRYQPNNSSPDLVNSDLFGHKKGSFTGASDNRKGLLLEADKGTIFLDEIDEFPQSVQVAILGVLQDKKFRVVGDNREQPIDVRLITASNSVLSKSIEEGKLRKDLYHRISHLTINIPPLRDRLSDIEALTTHFIKNLTMADELNVYGISSSAIERLISYDWPGNIRELEAKITAAAYRAQYRRSREIELSDVEIDSQATMPPTVGSFHDKVQHFKSSLVRQALDKTKGNQLQAAKLIGLDRTSLRRIMSMLRAD